MKPTVYLTLTSPYAHILLLYSGARRLIIVGIRKSRSEITRRHLHLLHGLCLKLATASERWIGAGERKGVEEGHEI
jgi:hypothetical protein